MRKYVVNVSNVHIDEVRSTFTDTDYGPVSVKLTKRYVVPYN